MIERKYVALSLKHSDPKRNYWPFWGRKRTTDCENRCYSGYVTDLDKCELYSIEEFRDKYRHIDFCFLFEPIEKPTKDALGKLKKKYDTVFMTLETAKEFTGYKPPKKPTNYQRYFGTPEKAAKWLNDKVLCEYCRFYGECTADIEECEDIMRKWLESEAE